MKKLFSILLASLFAVSFAACSKSEYRPDAVVLYIEYNGVTGKEDDKVKAALEAKAAREAAKAAAAAEGPDEGARAPKEGE